MKNECLKKIVEVAKKIKKSQLGIIVLVYVLFSICFVGVVKWPYPNLTYPEWDNFLACFCGGAIGGLATLIAVYVTIKETRKIQDETRKMQEETNKEIRRSQYLEEVRRNKPLLLLEEFLTEGILKMEVRYNIGRDNGNTISIQKLSNVGMGIAKDIKISGKLKNGQEWYVENTNILMSKSSKESLYSDVGYDVEIDYSKPLKITYTDVFGNLYSTIYYIDNFEHKYTKYIKIKSIYFEEEIK